MNRNENFENLRNTANYFVELEKANKKIKELEEENKRLSKNQRYYKNGVFSLENDKETMSDMIDDYKSRIEKALNYIIERYDYQGHALTHTFDKDNVRELLKILKGE